MKKSLGLIKRATKWYLNLVAESYTLLPDGSVVLINKQSKQSNYDKWM